MSNNETAKRDVWVAKLGGDSVDDQVDALRQIASEETVTGFTQQVIELSGSRSDDVRMWASEVLETTVQPDPSDVAGLANLLRTSVDGEVCYWAATMFGRLGKDAAPAVGALESCVRESMYLPARERATWALSQIGTAASEAVPTLKEAAQTAPPRLRRLATEALKVILGDEHAADFAA